MSKMDVQIMVVETKKLLNWHYFHGFVSHWMFDFVSNIYNNFQYMRRGDAEENVLYDQPIVYAALVDKNEKKIFCYQRGNSWGEEKLRWNRSFWIWWHVDLIEWEENAHILEKHLEREIKEEVWLDTNEYTYKVVWYINDDSNSVWRVHFGLVYIVYVDSKQLTLEEDVITKWSFLSLNEITKLMEEWWMETRSELSFFWIKNELEIL